LNPDYPEEPATEPAKTHYVGIAGVGKDGPTLPVTSPKAGIFAYNRETKLRDILDGTSNTLIVTEATGKSAGPWAQGGPSTIRAFTTNPYVNGPDGIGGPYPGGINAAMADGSVRFLSEKTDPKVLEALATMRGGEVIGDY
jgi:prepilin-type processing-associated H-X9-DG protein